MARQIEELAAFVADAHWEDVPPFVRDHTSLVFLDTLGVILAGSERPEVRLLRDSSRAVAAVAPQSMRLAGRLRTLAPPRC